MKVKLLLALAILLATAATAQPNKGLAVGKLNGKSGETHRLHGTWMYGNFSTAEYWSKSPSTYLGKAFSMAIAFVFKPDGTYEHYFTSQATDPGGATYHQSFTTGRYTVDKATQSLTVSPLSSHYKRTRNGAVQEDRDMRPDEISKASGYSYQLGAESNGGPSLSLTIAGTKSTLTFLKKNF